MNPFVLFLSFLQTAPKVSLGGAKLPLPRNTKAGGQLISLILPLLPISFVCILKLKTQAHVGRAPL